MLYSMTGYGSSDVRLSNLEVQIEVKSVNGKNIDMSIRIPSQMKPIEMDMRNYIQDTLKRGSIDLLITVNENDAGKPVDLNIALLEKFLKSLKTFSDKHQLDDSQILPALVSLPDVVSSSLDTLDPSDAEELTAGLDRALDELTSYRAAEGTKIESTLRENIQQIKVLSADIDLYEDERKEVIKNRLRKNAEELSSTVELDKNRFEQELFYYIEKIDISEEKQRLQSHLDYFIEILDTDIDTKGKQLNFVSQEIGRELNTLGAKSYNNQMQVLVIQMKDELEKIKEQILNIL